MAVVKGPLFSLDASGSVAGAITFSKWKGRAYVRQRVIPSNPKSAAQTGRRAMMRFLAQRWAAIGTADQASWQDIADQLTASPFNAYISKGMEEWHNWLYPSESFPADRALTPSDNALTAAAWEENRIKLTVAGAALGDAWGIGIHGTLASGPELGVHNTILCELDDSIASHVFYWTPPSVATWYFDTICFSTDGKVAAPGGEQSAAPP